MSILLDHPNFRRHGLSSGVVKRFERQIKDESVPVLEKLVTWGNLISFVEEAEELLLNDEANEELRTIHKGLTETSIVLGECLLKEEKIDLAFEHVSFTLDDFKAKIRMLRYKSRMWHGDLDSEKSEQLLNALFSGLR